MKTAKRVLPVLLALLMLALSVPLASAEVYEAYLIDVSFKNGVLTFSMGEGDPQRQVFDQFTPGTGDEASIQPASVKSIIIKESADQLLHKWYNGGEVTITQEKENGITIYACLEDHFPEFQNPYIDHYVYPAVVKNESMRSYVLMGAGYSLTQDGKRVGFNYDALCGEYWYVTRDEQELIKEFNRRFGTNFSTADECRSFVLPLEMVLEVNEQGEYLPNYIAPTLVYCKKGSKQQTVCDTYRMPYILLDASTAKTDSATGVKATYNNTAFSAPVNLRVQKVSAGQSNAVAYDVAPTDANGQKLQPSQPVELRFPIPEGWNANDLQIVHTKEDGTKETPEFVVDEDDAALYASSFSTFTLVNTAGAAAPDQPEPETQEQQPTQNDSQTQPSGENKDNAPKLNFFQRIIEWFRNLFAKLFGRK